MEKNHQILFIICVKPNLIIDEAYFIWIAVTEDNAYKVFKKKKN